ncbi:hypothetical protein WJX72_010990 [[Myrmecia] bisecta]|uniref:Uncharacterized protein n=1 Tax=[Myrmecia] bisecta TaxID=41462 RepID=A0AAW1PH95_9CHLO
MLAYIAAMFTCKTPFKPQQAHDRMQQDTDTLQKFLHDDLGSDQHNQDSTYSHLFNVLKDAMGLVLSEDADDVLVAYGTLLHQHGPVPMNLVRRLCESGSRPDLAARAVSTALVNACENQLRYQTDFMAGAPSTVISGRTAGLVGNGVHFRTVLSTFIGSTAAWCAV